MDVAYDHIQEEALSPEESKEAGSKQDVPTKSTLNNDFQEAYKAISSSPWGARLGGFFGSVVKQGETVYKEAQQEFSAVSEEATKGFTDLRSSLLSRTRGLTLSSTPDVDANSDGSSKAPATSTVETTDDNEKDTLDSEGVLSRLQAEAAKRLKDIQKAEDAADEALLKFGTNIRNFLRDAVSIAPPSETDQSNTVLFESKDASGKRAIHTTRFDAQIHVIHSSPDSFSKNPASEEYDGWAKEFDVEQKTEHISKDLEKYDELRATMEKLVPNQVAYADFWKRYYFLRHSIETAEARRKDLLKAATPADDEVGWDEESEDETPDKVDPPPQDTRPLSVASSTTIHPATSPQPDRTFLDASKPRRSNDEKSQPDSEASYDVVGAASGAPSRAPGSPQVSKKGDDSEEEDWE